MNEARADLFVASYGDATSIDNSSGTPWHVTDGLRREGADARGLVLSPPAPWGRRAHALGHLLTTGGYGGYQYAPGNLDRIWTPVRERIRGARVLNMFQLYAPAVVADPSVRRWYYLDATLQQLIDVFGDLPHMSAKAKAALIERERLGYHAAEGLIAHSHWAAASMIADYGVPAARVSVVVPGANLDLDRYAEWRAQRIRFGPRHGPLRLIFTGMHAHRKGLDRLLEAISVARARGADLALDVIGCGSETMPEHLRALGGVTWHGRIDKRTHADHYNDLIARAEVGCLLSRAECGGIGLREYAAFGLALIAPDTGGSPEHAGRDRAVLIGPEVSPVTIADTLVELAMRGSLYQRLRAAAQAQLDEPLQTTAARQLLAIMMKASPAA